MSQFKDFINEIINNEALLEIGRAAVEDELVKLRDSRISIINRGNGLVIKEADGRESHLIRMGMETALKIALKSILENYNPKCLGSGYCMKDPEGVLALHHPDCPRF